MLLNRLGLLMITWLACFTSHVAAGIAEDQQATAADNLAKLLQQSDYFSATFMQNVSDEKGFLMDESKGQIFFTRPNTLRWNIDEPYQQVLLIKDQKYYQYDQDIDQLLIEPLNQQLMFTPVMLLSGDIDSIKENYTVSLKTQEPAEGGPKNYQLLPKLENGLFKSLQLSFQDEKLVEMVLLDDLLQTNRFIFSNIDTTSPIDQAIYRLDPPPYTDIIER